VTQLIDSVVMKHVINMTEDTDRIVNAKVLVLMPFSLSKSGQAKLAILSTSLHTVVLGVWKTATDKDPRKTNIPVGTGWIRERLAYLVSEIVGLHNVPLVVIRSIDNVVGSLQLFVDAVPWKRAGLDYRDVAIQEWQKLALLDYLICSTDRHRRNWLVDAQGTLWAIDNELCFPEHYEYGVFLGYRSRPHQLLSQHEDCVLQDEVLQLLTEQKKQEIMHHLLTYGIGCTGRSIFSHRWDQVIHTGTLPVYVESRKGFMHG